jgi:hypothetical protein
MKLLRRTLATALFPLVWACASSSWQGVPQPYPDDPLADGYARVVVVRTFGVVGSLRDVRIFDEQREIGVLRSNGWMCWDRPARRGVGRAEFDGYVLDRGSVENVFDMPREAGTTTWAVLTLRASDRKPMAEIVSPEEGRALIAGREPARVR